MYRPRTKAQRKVDAVNAELYALSKKFQRVFETDDGRAVLEHIMHGICQIDRSITHFDPHRLYYQSGARDAGLKVAALIEGITQNEDANDA